MTCAKTPALYKRMFTLRLAMVFASQVIITVSPRLNDSPPFGKTTPIAGCGGATIIKELSLTSTLPGVLEASSHIVKIFTISLPTARILYVPGAMSQHVPGAGRAAFALSKSQTFFAFHENAEPSCCIHPTIRAEGSLAVVA